MKRLRFPSENFLFARNYEKNERSERFESNNSNPGSRYGALGGKCVLDGLRNTKLIRNHG